MNARIAETKECTRLALSDGLGDMLHRRRCPECRAAAGADAMLRVALDCMGTEAGGRSPGAPGPGVETVLSSLGVRGPSVAGRIFARARRAALRTAVALPITMAALAVWTVWLDRDPGVAITAQSMPSPNAFRSFAQAGAEVGGAFDIDNLAIRLPNVAQVDARAFGSLLPRASVTGPPWSFAAEPPELKATEALVAKHASALRTLRLGLWCGYAESLSASMNEGMAHLEGYRRLARLLALEGYVHEKRGRPREAVDSYLDAVKLGISCQHGAPRIGRLVGLTCEAVGRAGLWGILPRLGADDAAHAAKRLDDMAATKPDISRMFDADRRIGSAIIAQATDDPLWRLRGWAALMQQPDPNPAWWHGPVNYLTTLPASRIGLVERYRRFTQIAEARAKWEYPRTPSTERWGLFDFFGNQFLGSYGEVVLMNDVDTAQNSLLAASLAARAYRARHGEDPDTLDALVQAGLLRNVPDDPFDKARKPLRYSMVLGEPVIYSIGPDGLDHGGVRAVEQSTNTNSTECRSITETTVGDIVAGRNIGW